MKIIKSPTQVERVMQAPTQPNKPVIQSQTRTEEERPKQTERIPFGQGNSKLVAMKIPGYHLHWINDWHPQTPDRLNQAMQAGYIFVTQEETVTNGLLGGGTTVDLSNRVSRIVGTRPDGEAITAYLMKCQTEYHLDNQKPVWDRADSVDRAIRGGKFKENAGDGRYKPQNSPIKLSDELRKGEIDG